MAAPKNSEYNCDQLSQQADVHNGQVEVPL